MVKRKVKLSVLLLSLALVMMLVMTSCVLTLEPDTPSGGVSDDGSTSGGASDTSGGTSPDKSENGGTSDTNGGTEPDKSENGGTADTNDSSDKVTEDCNHIFNEWCTLTDPTCTEDGKQERCCYFCGETEYKSLPKLGHTEKAVKGYKAYCTTDGLTDGVYCSLCGDVLIEQKVIASTGHKYEQTVIQPSPAGSGYTLHECNKCYHSYKDSYIEFENVPTASLIYKSNGDSTCDVVGMSDNTVQYVLIPEISPDGDTVVAIANEAFEDSQAIVYVSIPDTVTFIGSRAFYSCENLKTVIFPRTGDESLVISTYAFAECGIEAIDMTYTSMEAVNNHAFYGCKSLKTVKLNGVKLIDSFAFMSCNELESLIHTGELTSIGDRAFYSCKKLTVLRSESSQHNLDTVLRFGSNSFAFSAIRDIVFNKDIKATNSAFEYCMNLGTVDCSQTSWSCTVSFCGSKIDRLIFSPNVTTIGGYAFSGATLDGLILPDSITNIEYGAFMGATLGKVVFGSGLKLIGQGAFKDATATYDFSKVNADLSIGSEAFANNTFTTFAFPKSTVSIGAAALMGCNNLKVLTIPFVSDDAESTFVSTDCFAWLFGHSVDCWDQDDAVPKSLKTVIIHGENPGVRDFMNVMVTDVVIGKEITSIGNENFDSYISALKRLYYEGTEEEWSNVSVDYSMNRNLETANKYFYSEKKPTSVGNFWHYDESGDPVKW